MTAFFTKCLIVCPLVFLAGFIDAIAGGGGIITIPAYLLAGLPAHLAVGTNKTVAGLGTLTSVFKYIKNGAVIGDVALFASMGSITGAFIGSGIALHLSEQVLKTILLVALPCVALFLTFNRGFGLNDGAMKSHSPTKRRLLSLLVGLVVGGYDGLIGPGAGTFLIIGFAAVLGTDLLTGSACGRVTNLASNLTSMLMYIHAGQVDFLLTVPAAVCYGLGGYAGSGYALKGGSKNVRKVMFVVLALLFIKVGMDLAGVSF